MRNKNVIISQGNRPLWQLVIASIFYTTAFYFLYTFFISIDLYGKTNEVKNSVSALEAAMILFLGGLGFSGTKDYYFDFENNRYKQVLRIGPIKIGKWQHFRNLKYISVFKNQKMEFEVNLWYDHNKHFNISLFDGKEDAMIEAKQLAKKLTLDLLDATEANNHRWIPTD